MVSESNVPTNDTAIGRFRRWYWRPPRAHGEAIEDRTVGFLELFYDLVYVVVIAQAAHHLAEHLTGRGVIEFAIVFGLIWIAWLNGTLYVDLHGREDGRTRTLVFAQMALLALLAVFTSGAGSKTSTEFALVYIAFMLLLIAMWYSVRRQDDPRFHAMTARYLAGMIVTVAAIAISVVLPDGLRLAVWAAVTVGWVVGTLVAALVASRRGRDASDLGGTPTDSLVERFGLFTIIVLGEVVVGVVDGMGEIESDLLDDGDRVPGARGRLRPVVGLLRLRRPPPASRRCRLVNPLDDEPPAGDRLDRRGWRVDGEPHPPCPR